MLSDADRKIAEVAPRLADGKLGVGTLLHECLARIAASDGRLHAMLRIDPSASEQAHAKDRARDWARGEGGTLGLLHGVPIVVKDNIDVAGMPTTSGCRALAGAMPRGDAVQVARLRAAGAVIVGKTNLSEFSFEIRCRSSLGGDTVSPFRRDADVTCGGSSGGTAAAVAAGFALAGLGTDTGGSLRVPAAYNGLVGLRPTWGRLDLIGVAPLAPSTDTIGPIARSVDDVSLLFSVMSGTAQIAEPPAIAGLSLAGMRVGVLRQAFGAISAIGDAVLGAAASLTMAGARIVDPVALPEELLPVGAAHIVDAEFADAFDRYLGSAFAPGTAPASLAAIMASGDFLPDYRTSLGSRLACRGVARDAILARHRALRDGLAQLMATNALDALLYPTSAVVPSTLDNPAGGWAPELAACSGWPALSVPTGATLDGIPIGAELLAPPGEEPRLFALARAIEAVAGPRLLPPR